MRFNNPIITGFAADPSICFAKGYYYLVNSSFAYFPAIPVFRSIDLVNWEQVGNALDSIDEIDTDNLDINGGVWAPTIRYLDGVFFICAAVEKVGNLIIHTFNPEGAWSKPVWVDYGGIDPSLFFEDGKAYFCTNDWSDGRPGVWLGVVDPYSGQILQDFKCVYRGNDGGWLEAPHIYHIGEYYYLMAAEGGTYSGHMEIVARSKDILGPYENCPMNPILTNRNDTGKAISCTGHGDLIKTEAGHYYMVHLGCRPGKLSVSPLGRETFLSPVEFCDGWPVVKGKMAHIENECNDFAGRQNTDKAFVDSFTNDKWPIEWRFLRGKGKNNFKRHSGCLLAELKEGDSEAFAYVRQPDLKFECQVKMLASDTEFSEGSACGMRVFLADDFNIFWGIKREKDWYKLVLEQKADELKVRHLNVEMSQIDGAISLIVSGNKDGYVFVASGENFDNISASVSNRFLSPSVMDRSFVGTMLGIGVIGREGCSSVTFKSIKVSW